MRVALVVPIDPEESGTGLAHRARVWQRALRPLGDLTTIVVPVAGPAPPVAPLIPSRAASAQRSGPSADTVIHIAPEQTDHPLLPDLAQGAPEHLGAAFSTELQPFDVIVGLRSYLGPFCAGLRGATHARLVIDLDDDDAAFHASIGDHDAAARFADLVDSLANRCDLLVTATSDDRDGKGFVPNAVDLMDHPRAGAHRSPPLAGGRIVMVGNFGYAPNVDGLRWFEDEVLPLDIERRAGVEFVVVGPQSDAHSPHGVGFVDDLADQYRSSDVAVVPIRAGSGSRIKVLEAWAHRVPVIGTPVGLAGLAAVHRRHALVADTAHAFADQVVTLLDDEALAGHLVDGGHALVREDHDAEAVAARARALVTSLVDGSLEPVYLPMPQLEIGELPDGVAIHDPATGRAHRLNASAAVVHALVSRPTRRSELLGELDGLYGPQAFGQDTIEATLADLVASGLLGRSVAGELGE